MNRLILISLLFFLWASPLDAQAPFYQGNPIRIIVGYLSGDSHDLWARSYARHMGAHPETHSFCKNCSDRTNKRL